MRSLGGDILTWFLLILLLWGAWGKSEVRNATFYASLLVLTLWNLWRDHEYGNYRFLLMGIFVALYTVGLIRRSKRMR